MIDTAHNLEIRRKRLRYRSWHRGCKETDVILGTFADNQLWGLDSGALDLYEALLEEDDADIWAWLTGQGDTPPKAYEPLIPMLLQYKA